jgi:hypothetical protein
MASRDADRAFIAGYVAGEGSFAIRANNGGQSWACTFSLTARADDTELLLWLRDLSGCGALYARPAQGNAKPQTAWTVWRKADCARLAGFLAATPMLNKKARDFEVWREAVAAWLETGGGSRSRDGRMARLVHRLREHRSYSVQPDYVPVDISPTYLRPHLSGFATAEGHFGSTESGYPRFAINLRRDDRAFLEFAQRHYRIGDLRLVPASGGSRPAASWRVGRLADVARLAQILDGYPPRGRQGDVYRAWRALVAHRVESPQGSPTPQELLVRRELAWGVRIARVYRSTPPVAPPDRTSARREQCERALHAWHSAAGDTDLTATAYERFRRAASTKWPTRNTVAHTFGSWRDALEACGLPTDASRGADCITRAARTGASKRSARRLAQRESIAAAARRCRDDLGREPAALEFFRWRLHTAPTTPSQMTVYRAFPGGWREVVAEAFGSDEPRCKTHPADRSP